MVHQLSSTKLHDITNQNTNSTVLVERSNCSSAVKKFPAFYETRKFITMVTRSRHSHLWLERWVLFTPSNPTFWRSIWILSSFLPLGPPSGVVSKAYMQFYTICFTRSVHFNLFDFVTQVICGKTYKSEYYNLKIKKNKIIKNLHSTANKYSWYSVRCVNKSISFRACRSCPANLTDCFLNQCVTADGYERGILTVNHQLPGPSIQVKAINPWTRIFSVSTTRLITERVYPHNAFTYWAL